MKFCPKCQTEKPKTEFYTVIAKKDGLDYRCKDCARANSREAAKRWRLRHPERARESIERYLKNNTEQIKKNKQKFRERWSYKTLEYRLKHEYGLTLFQYNQMLLNQQNLCKICKQFMRPACVDHCHSSGKVRGLVCDNCNVGLGRFKDSTILLQSAIEYLQQ